MRRTPWPCIAAKKPTADWGLAWLSPGHWLIGAEATAPSQAYWQPAAGRQGCWGVSEPPLTGTHRSEARRYGRCPRPGRAGGPRRPRPGSVGRSAPARTRARRPAPGSGSARLRPDGRPAEAAGQWGEGFGVVGRSWHGSRLQDSGQPSAGCWRVLSVQLRSDASSGQCAPVGPSNTRWNDRRNDRRGSVGPRRAGGSRGRGRVDSPGGGRRFTA
jgi:hypothetical protein